MIERNHRFGGAGRDEAAFGEGAQDRDHASFELGSVTVLALIMAAMLPASIVGLASLAVAVYGNATPLIVVTNVSPGCTPVPRGRNWR